MAKLRTLTLLCVALVASAVAPPYDFEDEPRSSSDVAFEAEDEPRGLELHEEDDNLGINDEGDSDIELDDEEPEMRDDDDDEDVELEPEARGEEKEDLELEPEVRDDDDEDLEPEASDRRSQMLWKTNSNGLRCLRFIGRSLRCAAWDTPVRRPRVTPRPVPWWFRFFPWG